MSADDNNESASLGGMIKNYAKYGCIKPEIKELILDELKAIEGMIENSEEMASQVDNMNKIIGSVGSLFGKMSDSDREFCIKKLDTAIEVFQTQQDMLDELEPYWNLLGYWEGKAINSLPLSDFQNLYRSVYNKYRKIASNYYEYYRLYYSLAEIKFVPEKPWVKATIEARDIMNKAVNKGCFVFLLKEETEVPSKCATHPDKKTPQNTSSHPNREVSSTDTRHTDKDVTQTASPQSQQNIDSEVAQIRHRAEELAKATQSTTQTTTPTQSASIPPTETTTTQNKKRPAKEKKPKQKEKPLNLSKSDIGMIEAYLDKLQKERKSKDILNITLILFIPFAAVLWFITAGIYAIILLVTGGEVQTIQGLITCIIAIIGSLIIGVFCGYQRNKKHAVWRCRDCGLLIQKPASPCPNCNKEKPTYDKFTMRELRLMQEDVVIVAGREEKKQSGSYGWSSSSSIKTTSSGPSDGHSKWKMSKKAKK